MPFPHAGVHPPDSWPNQKGTPTPGATLGVYTDQAATTLATLYSDRDRAAGTNPFTLDAYGNNPEFFAEPGDYWIARIENGTPGATISLSVDVDPEDAIEEPTGGGPGAVVSVNGQTGIVVLDATDVGADTAGAAAAVEADAVMDGDAAGGVLAGTYPNPSFAVDMATQAELNAEAVLARNADNLTSGTVADARIAATIARDSEVAVVAGDLAAHIADAADAHDASAVSVVPFGSVAATDVQAALQEILAEAVGAVTSVNGETGVVVLDAGDVGADPAGSAATVAANLAAHIGDTSDAHDASAISSVPAGNLAATDVQGALNELDGDKATTGSVTTVANDLAAHIADSSDAHAGAAITNTPAGNIAATTVQAAINELDSEKAAVAEPIAAAHIVDAADAHAGTAITNTPAGGIAATTVQAAINELDTEKAPLASPALTGNPTAPTASPGDNDTSIATTAFVTAADTALLTATITNGDTTHAPNGDAVFDALALKAPLASPALTGTPTAPTQSAADNSTRIATTAYADAKVADAINDSTTGIAPSQNAVFDALALKAALASPALTGNPTAPTQSAGTNNTRIATTAYADALVADAINNGTTGIAPSQNAVFDALALKAPLTPTVGAALGTTGSVALDFDALNGTFQTIALSGNITFTTSNLSAGESVTLFISAASLRTFTFPAWIFVGSAAPASIAAGKSGVLTLTSTTTADTGVYAAWAVQP